MKWYKFEDEKPQQGQQCIVVWPGDKRPWMAGYFITNWVTSSGVTIHVTDHPERNPTHWMPLMEIPDEHV